MIDGLLRKRVLIFSVLMIFLSLIFLYCDEDDRDNKYLLFGVTVKPLPKALSNSWVISQGRDFSIIDQLFFGYETGISYKIFENIAKYHFKTLFNFKYNYIHLKQVTFYFGAGTGLLELLKVTRLDSDFGFYVGYQGIIGFKIGPPKKDKFCFEIQFLDSTEEGRGIQINFLTGVRF